MTLVVDASVALKWVMLEAGSEAARELVHEDALAAPDLLLVECANVLWAQVRRRRLDPDAASAALTAILSCPVLIVPSAALITAAYGIAFALGRSVYDSLYLAVAMDQRATLVTADAAFARAALANAAYAGAVRPLI